MNLLDVMTQIGTRLDTIDGLRVYDFPPDAIVPPAAVITYPDEIAYDSTYGRGMDRMTLPVMIVVGRANDRAARNELTPYTDGGSPDAIKTVLEGGSYAAFDSVRVTRVEFNVTTIAGIDYLAATFELDIIGKGA